MKRVKLLLIAPTFYPTHGGAELRFFRYLPFLKNNGVDVHVISGTPKRKKFTAADETAEWRKSSNSKLISKEKIQGAQVYKYKLPERNGTKRLAILLDQTIKHCQLEKTCPSIIHIISPISTKLITRLEKLKALDVSIVFSYCLAHSFSDIYLIRYWQKKQIRKVYKFYDQIITASDVLKDFVLDIDPNANVKIIPNGIDAEKFSPLSNREEKLILRKKLKLPTDGIYITLVGAIHPRKGTDLLVNAWSKLINEYVNLHLLLIGPRYDQTREELKDFKQNIEASILRSNRHENIHFIGQINNVDEYLKASDMFVYPSAKEGMPNAVLEAMACGLPTLLTPFIGLSQDFGEPSSEYLIAERNETDIAKNIKAMLDDESLFEGLSKRSRAWIENTMDLNTSVRAHVIAYNLLIK